MGDKGAGPINEADAHTDADQACAPRAPKLGAAMTDEQFDKAIAANATRAAISYRNGDDISGDYWTEQAERLSDQRELARRRELLTDVLKGTPDHSSC